ncbi:unnamed protein product [Miscanthus lutarioriparius]|uniref:Uncharacterized protein n=1 Tax=Miscanthus lutarioriparius TaxID=422564 RepID=A0A811M591_9POAL|nr:unnamed protein product [Miscanthus lutarioriparius]
MASLHPGSPGLGARPRPMDPQRLLHLVQDGGCLLRLFSKPAGDGALVDLWLAAFGFRRGFGLQGFQGMLGTAVFCILCQRIYIHTSPCMVSLTINTGLKIARKTETNGDKRANERNEPPRLQQQQKKETGQTVWRQCRELGAEGAGRLKQPSIADASYAWKSEESGKEWTPC